MPGMTLSGPVVAQGVMLTGDSMFLQPLRPPVPGAKTWWVSSTSATPGDGTEAEKPLPALFSQYGGLSKLAGRVNKGDVVYLLPGHTESIDAADKGSYTGTGAGFSVIGLGWGNQRPILTWTAATATWLFDTAGVILENCVLYMGGASSTGALTVAAPITVSAADCAIRNCYINYGWDADSGVTIGVTVASGADRFTFANNTVVCVETAGTALTTSFIRATAAVDLLRITNNHMVGSTSDRDIGLISVPAATAITNVFIVGNYIHNTKTTTTTSRCCISLATATITGIIAWNYCRVMTDAAVAAIGNGANSVAANFIDASLFNNYVVNNDGETGILIGTASV